MYLKSSLFKYIGGFLYIIYKAPSLEALQKELYQWNTVWL